jgi:hypothetical protein
MKSRIHLLILICFLTTSTNELFAQENEVQENNDVKAPILSIKWSPIHLAYFYPSFQVALEHRIYKNLSAQYDIGYILDYPNADSEEYTNKTGYRFIGELRYYVPHPPKIPFYVAAEYYNSRISFDRYSVVGYDCTAGCSFYEYVNYKVENKHNGYGMKFGILLYPGWNKNKSFFFDLNFGAAYRNITYTDIGKPVDSNITYFDNDDSTPFSPSEQDRSGIRLVMGVRIGYRFF